MRKLSPVLFLLAAIWIAPCTALGATPPLSTVQFEKLVKRVEDKGATGELASPVSAALGLGDGAGLIVRSLNYYDANNGKHYTFGIVVGAGYYFATLSDGSSPHLFLFDENLKIVKALKTGFGLETMTPAEASAEANELLRQFANYIEIN